MLIPYVTPDAMHRVPPPPSPSPPSEDPPVEEEEAGDREDIAEVTPEEGKIENALPSEEVESMEAVMKEEDDELDEPGMWEETFKTHHDSKPYGMM